MATIQNSGFIRDTLDFLTNGNYTEQDVAAMKEQMEDIVLELAQQIKDGKEIDLNSVQTKLTIGGSEIGVGQLFELQSLGKKLEGVLNQTSVGQIHSFASAQKGLAKSIAEYYGKDYGAVGDMFADGIGRLYEKSIQNVQKLNNSMNSGYGGIGWSQKENDSVHTNLEISDLFADLDCSSKDAFIADFNAKLSDMRTLVQQFGKKYNLSDSYLGIAGDTFADLDCSSKDAFIADFNAKLSDMRTLVQQFGKKYNLSDSYLGIAGDTANLIKYMQSMIQ